MHAFDVLGDPVRRRILELLTSGEMTAGEIVDAVGAEFAISQPAVSQHLKVLREAGFASRRAHGTRRLYALEPAPLRDVDEWIDPFRRFWAPRLDALSTEIARGKRRRNEPDHDDPAESTAASGNTAGSTAASDSTNRDAVDTARTDSEEKS
ncbi:MAG: ArsR/SmtB family transcription factor [Brevibacterium sp.]